MLTRSALIYLSRQEGLKDFATRFSLFKKLTTRFIAGENIDEAVAAIKEVNARGCTATFDHLNESVSSPAETEAEVREYQDVLARIDESGIDSNVSIKLTQFGLEIDPDLAYRNARRVVEDAVRRALARMVVASVGPTTSETLRESGIQVDLEPSHPKMGFLVNETAKQAGQILQSKQ